jgi:hypothetical protein
MSKFCGVLSCGGVEHEAEVSLVDVPWHCSLVLMLYIMLSVRLLPC